MDHIAWLLEEHGITRKIVAVQRVLWPTLVRVTFEDGTQEVHPRLNVLSRDDLDQRFDFGTMSDKITNYERGNA